MSMGRTGHDVVPHARAWPLESRRQMMRDVIRIIASKCALKIENAPAIARTYDVPVACVEAEMMKHMQEGEAK